MHVERLQDEHRELQGMRRELIAVIVARDGAAVTALRWRFCRVLLAHLASEEALVYAPLIREGGPAGKEAQVFLKEVGGLSGAFRAYIAAWPIARILSNWPEFDRETRVLMTALATRIGREESRLYPLAVRMEHRSAA